MTSLSKDYTNKEKKVILQTLWKNNSREHLHSEALKLTSEELGVPEHDIDCIYLDAPIRDGSDL